MANALSIINLNHTEKKIIILLNHENNYIV